uniref:Transmembrane protein n=1 Tax=Spironucleus salmonicida TaxID=348837 RepID=V6LQ63_9EUKA|eukprot:EST42899.1 Hypothetical protein SS50377_17432 [Spironucleus salmonicida]
MIPLTFKVILILNMKAFSLYNQLEIYLTKILFRFQFKQIINILTSQIYPIRRIYQYKNIFKSQKNQQLIAYIPLSSEYIISNRITNLYIYQDPTCFSFLSSGNDIYVEVNQPSGFYGNLLIPVSAESKHDLTSPVFIIIWLVLASLSVLAVVLGGVYYCRGFRRVRKNGYNIIVQ